MSLSFNGSTDHLLYSGILTGLTPPFCVSAWYRGNATALTESYIFTTTDDVAEAEGWRLFVQSGNLRCSAKSAGASFGSTTSAAVTDNNWHHAFGRWQTSTSRHSYWDGGNQGTSSNTRNPTAHINTRIGTLYNGSYLGNTGFELAEVGIWNADVVDHLHLLAQGVSPAQIAPQSLLSYFPDGGSYDVMGKAWTRTGGIFTPPPPKPLSLTVGRRRRLLTV